MNFPDPSDNQAVFNFVVNHLRQQKLQSTDDPTGGCVYKSKDGTSCAVGCLIPEEEYTSSFEGEPLNRYLEDVVNDTNEITHWVHNKGYDSRLLCELQWLHDDNDNWGCSFEYSDLRPPLNWIKEDAIMRYADELKLTYVPLSYDTIDPAERQFYSPSDPTAKEPQ